MRHWFRSGLGIVLAYFFMGGAIFLLQLIPYTGIFVMFLGAIIWIGLLVHLAMAHLAIASLFGVISRAWIATPIVFYGAGFALHLLSVRLVNNEVAAIEAANAASAIKAEPPLSFLADISIDSLELLRHYRIDRILIREGSRANDPVTARSYARGEECSRANKGYFYEKRHEPWLLMSDLFPSYKGEGKSRQCIVSQYGVPAEWRYRISIEHAPNESSLFQRFVRKWTVIDEPTGTKLLSVEAGGFKTLGPIPMFYAGCGLNSGAARWDCGAGMMHTSLLISAGYKPRISSSGGYAVRDVSDPDTLEVSALARALSLELRHPTD
jgi:hypothetical protein